MAKAAKSPASRDAATPTVKLAGFTPAEWKQHMDVDEDWTERLEGASAATVAEIVAALDHGDGEVRLLACNLVYALGLDGLADATTDAIARVGALASGETKAKIRARARLVHESLSADLQRAQIRRELPWLAGFSADAIAAATAAIDDPRDTVRVQVYVWWANAGAVPAAARGGIADKLAAAAGRETDPIAKRAAELAQAHVRG